MSKPLVYDSPTRVFHWIFAILFVGAFFIAKTYDDDSTLYPYHMMMGLTMVFLVSLRILWGLFGSRYAKFSSFKLNPMDLVEYFKGFFTASGARTLGHNPASSWAAVIMMILTIGLGGTGYLMVNGTNKEFFEEIHELFANAFVIVVIGHIAGIVLHTLRHKEAIGLSMIHGKKDAVKGEVGIPGSLNWAGILMIALVGLFVFNLNKNYNTQTRSLNLFGTTLQLGENESNENGEAGAGENKDAGEKDDDGDDD